MSRRPNILFLMADQFRSDWMSCAGGPANTPNLDMIAREGIRFSNCCTPSPLCVPARVSLMTGKYPHTTGAWDNAPYVLSPEADLWTKRIRALGYDTSVFGKLHLHGDKGDVIAREPIVRGYGFDTVDETSGPHAACQARTHMGELWKEKGLWADYCADMNSRGKRPHAKPSSLPLEDYYDVYVGRRGKEYLETCRGDTPWFCHISFGGPHEPWDTPEPYASMYPPWSMPAPLPLTHDQNPDRPRGEFDRLMSREELRCTPDTAREIRADYSGGVTLIDKMIGEILDVVRARGEWDSTVILFTSDHGELNGDHGLVNKRNFFDSALKVPLLLRVPGLEGGRVSGELVNLLDVGPTLTELAGGRLDYIQFGRSLVPLLEGRVRHHRDYLLSEYAGELMYLDREWKLVTNKEGQPYQLFHLTCDPEELDNLASSSEAEEMESVLCRKLFLALAETRCLKPSPLQMPAPEPPGGPA